MRTVLVGAIVGWVGALAAYQRLVHAPPDLIVFAGVPVILLCVAAVASWLPALRVSTIDPAIALRGE